MFAIYDYLKGERGGYSSEHGHLRMPLAFNYLDQTYQLTDTQNNDGGGNKKQTWAKTKKEVGFMDE